MTMDDATRVTWSGVFVTLGSTMLFGAVARWVSWVDDRGNGARPQVLWTMGFLGLAFLLASAQLGVPVLRRIRAHQLSEERMAAERDDWRDQ
jgi:hypothetical protein